MRWVAAGCVSIIVLAASQTSPVLAQTEKLPAAPAEGTGATTTASPAIATAPAAGDNGSSSAAEPPAPAGTASETAAATSSESVATQSEPTVPASDKDQVATSAVPATPSVEASPETPSAAPTTPPAATSPPAAEAVAPTTESAPPAAAAAPSAEPATAEQAAKDENTLRAEVLRQVAVAKSSVIGRDDKAALTAFYEARGDDMLWVTGTGFSAKADQVMAEIRRADDWGLSASDFALPAALGAAPEQAALADTEIELSLAVLKYAKHARGGRMDPKQLSNYIDRDPPLLKPADVLAGIATAQSPDAYLRGLHPKHPQFEKLRQAYLALRAGTLQVPDEEAQPQRQSKQARTPSASPKETAIRRVLYNMEQWRWMPENLGATYVWANIPEYTIRVMRNGSPIHSERIIVGKTNSQTPIFSDNMETIVFHPFWGVPDSIKVKELLPGLARGGPVLEKNGLRIQYRGRDIDPSNVDWSTSDIRNFHVYQPPGGSNVLGVVKFLFPNKHQVYFHDTPTKNLFNASQRTFSHGCMRVRNPVRLAEVLLNEDKGWDARRVEGLVKGGPQDNGIPIEKKFPVHVTYFTASVDDDGKLNLRPDIYGHEPLIQLGLEGKASQIVKRKDDLGTVRAEVVGRLSETKSSGWSKQPSWIKDMFNF